MTVPSKPGSAVVTERSSLLMPLYKVLLHNDDHNTVEHVVKSLIQVFKMDRQTSERIMLETHTTGTGLCAIEPLEQAELHKDQLQSFSLIATIEPA
jgi:ATP-dependent Clp protease adaptor protein ClpS